MKIGDTFTIGKRKKRYTVIDVHPKMPERDVEKRMCDRAKTKGIVTYKFTSPARAAVPDRLLLAPVPEWLRPVIAQYVRFVEVKRTGAKPTAPQQREHERLRALGFTVDIVDSVESGAETVGGMG